MLHDIRIIILTIYTILPTYYRNFNPVVGEAYASVVEMVATPGYLLGGFQFQSGHLPVSYGEGMSNAANVALTPLTAGTNGGFVWGATTWSPQVRGSVKRQWGGFIRLRVWWRLICGARPHGTHRKFGSEEEEDRRKKHGLL